jgi:hypothetical protein
MILGNNKKRLVWLLFSIVILGYFYRYSPYKIEGLGCYNKIWAHRANSVDKANSAANYFNGFELDLIYNDTYNTFDVNHTSTKSKGLTFETYLNKIEVEEQPFMWLDIKNLKTDNSTLILKRLEMLFSKNNFKRPKIIVESKYPEALEIFNTLGYKTSYYLPTKLYAKSKEQLSEQITLINSKLKNQPYLAISSAHLDYAILSKYFPNRSKYIWALIGPYSISKFQDVRTVLNDTTVKVVLFNYNMLLN